MRYKRSAALAAAMLLLMLPAAHAAKCKVDGEWYDYDSPECQQGGAGEWQGSGGTGADRSESQGPRLEPGYAACLTEDHLDQAVRAATSGDDRLADSLYGDVCLRTSSDMAFSVLDQGWTKARVRVYADGESLDLWTVIEALPSDY